MAGSSVSSRRPRPPTSPWQLPEGRRETQLLGGVFAASVATEEGTVGVGHAAAFSATRARCELRTPSPPASTLGLCAPVGWVPKPRSRTPPHCSPSAPASSHPQPSCFPPPEAEAAADGGRALDGSGPSRPVAVGPGRVWSPVRLQEMSEGWRVCPETAPNVRSATCVGPQATFCHRQGTGRRRQNEEALDSAEGAREMDM